MTLTRTMWIRWTSPGGVRSSAVITREKEAGQTPEQFLQATLREVQDFARLGGWVPLAEERPLRRIARWLAGDRQ